MSADFDFIIIGAGSAGCVLADRLSADGKNRVLLLEFGGSDRSIFIQMPAALAYPMHSKKWNWGYESEPEPHLGGRRLNCPRGKGLGGSSSINGLVYVRGNPNDFERWKEEDGAKGWGYADVLPYFKRAEGRAEGGDEYRGGDGPLSTAYGPLNNPLHQAWLDAAPGHRVVCVNMDRAGGPADDRADRDLCGRRAVDEQDRADASRDDASQLAHRDVFVGLQWRRCRLLGDCDRNHGE